MALPKRQPQRKSTRKTLSRASSSVYDATVKVVTRTLSNPLFLLACFVGFYLSQNSSIIDKIVTRFNSTEVLKPIGSYISKKKDKIPGAAVTFLGTFGGIPTKLSTGVSLLVTVSVLEWLPVGTISEYMVYTFFAISVSTVRSTRLKTTLVCLAMLSLFAGFWGSQLFLAK